METGAVIIQEPVDKLLTPVSTEVRPSDQVDVQAEEFGEHTEPCSLEIKDESHGGGESVDAESKDENSEEKKHENLLHVSPGESEKYQDNEPETAIVNKNQFEEIPPDLTLEIDKEELKEDDETKVDQVHGTQTMQEQRGLDVESVEKTQKPSLESEETSKTIQGKEQQVTLHQKGQEEGSYGLETKEERASISESSELGEKACEEESLLPNEQEKETEFQKEQIETHEPTTNEQVPSHQQSPVKEKSNEVRQVPSASPSKELEVETIIQDIKANEDEQLADKTPETVETHSSLPPSSHKQEHGAVAEDKKVKDTEPMGDASQRSLQISETNYFDSVSEFEELKPEQVGEILEEERREVEEKRAERLPSSETKTVVEEKDSLVHDEETTAPESETLKDITQKTEEVLESARVNEEDNVSLEVKEEIDQSSKDTEEHEHMLVRDMPQDETIVSGAVDTSIVQESAMFNTLETKKDTETSLDLKQEKEQEPKTIISTDEAELGEIDEVKFSETIQEESNEILLDVPSGELEKYQDNEPETVLVSKKESMVSVEGDETKHDQTLLDAESSVEEMQNLTLQTPPSDVSGETSTTLDEKIEIKPREEVTPHQEDQEEVSYGLETKEETPESSELEEKSVADPTPPQEESCLSNEQEKETKLQKEQTEKHELKTNEEVPNDHHQSPVEEKSDHVPQVSSASPSEKLEESEEELVAEKIQKSLETTEPHSSLPASSEEKEHGTVAEADNIEDKNEEAEPTGDVSRKSLEVAETKNLSLSLEASKSDETEFEEQKPKQAREILEEDITQKTEEEQENPTVIETPTIQEEDIESKHEHALVRDMPHVDTLVTEAETVETSSVQESAILRTLETNVEETEAVHSEKIGDEEDPKTKENTETSVDMKEEETETVRNVISLDEVRSSDDVQVEEFGEHTKSCSLEMKDESEGSEKSGDVKSNETVQDESNKEKDLLDVPSGESDKHQDNEPEPVLVAKTESMVAVEDDETTHDKALLNDDETSENVCNKQEDIENLESLKLEDSKQDKSEEVSETVKAINDETPKKVEEIHEAETMEENKLHVADQILPVETSQPAKTPSLVSEINEEIHQEETKEAHKVETIGDQNLPAETLEAHQTPKQVEEIHEEETKEAHKLEAEEILPTKIIPREPSDEALVSMLASREEGNCASNVRETKDEEDETPVSADIEEILSQTKPKEPEDETQVETPTSPIISEKTDNEILVAEAKNGHEDINETEARVALGSSDTSKTAEDVCTKLEEFGKLEAPKLEESKEDKSQENLETAEEAIEVSSDHPVETSQAADQTLPPEAPKLEESKEDKSREILETVEEIEATGDHSVETSQADQTLPSELVSGLDDQTQRQVEEILEEERNEGLKFEATGDQSLPVETSKAYQTPSSDLASGLDNQTPQKVEEIHEEEKTEAHKLQVADDQISPVETSQEDQTPSLVSEQDDQTSEQVEEIHEEQTKKEHKLQEEENFLNVPRESFSEAPTSILASAEDEPMTLEEHNAPKNAFLQQEELKDIQTLQHSAIAEDQSPQRNDNPDYHAGEADHDDESSSTLPVVEILKGLQTTLETDREIEPADKEEPEGDAEVYSNEKDCASVIIEADKSQQVESGKTEKMQEENDLAGKEEFNLQEKVNVEEKLQEETREISECKEDSPEALPVEKVLIASSHFPSEELEHVISAGKQEEHESREDVNDSIPEKISLQEEHPGDSESSKKEEKAETHETVKEEAHIVDIKEGKKSDEEVQDEKLLDLSTTKDINFSSEVKKDKEDASVVASVQDFVSPDVEKEKETHSVLGSEEEVVTSEDKITELPSEAEKEPKEEHVEPQAVSGDTKSNADKSLTKEALEKPSEVIESNQSPILPLEKEVEETSFEVKKAQEDKDEEPANAFIKNDNVQVQDQPKEDFEASAKDKEITEQEQKPNDLTYVQEDVGTNVKAEVGDEALEEKAGLVEEKREVEYVKTETEDAVKTEVEQPNDPISEGNKNKENEEKETNVKNTDEVIESLSSVGNTQENLKQKYEVPNQEKREIAQENLQIAEELQKKDEESENTKDLFSQVKKPEPTMKEPARKSLSDLIPKVNETNKIEDATTKPHIKEEEVKTEEEDENGDDKISPDSIVMVEAKDTVHVIKTHHKKSQGILSGVGSKVKHSISKVKKVLTGKSSHTTKPSSPK